MGEAISFLPHKPSWRGQRHIYSLLYPASRTLAAFMILSQKMSFVDLCLSITLYGFFITQATEGCHMD
jgi:hypothetical protein